MPTPLKVEHFI